jgi:hypothetical protein
MTTNGKPDHILQTALERHADASRSFLRIVVVVGSLFMLLPAFLVVGELRTDRRDFCRSQHGFSLEMFGRCMSEAGFEKSSCDRVEPYPRRQQCQDVYKGCQASSISEEKIAECESYERLSAFGKAGAFAIIPALILLTGLVLTLKQRKERRVLAAALQPGALAQIEPYVLRIVVAGVPTSEKLVLRLLLRDGRRAELTVFDAAEEEAVVAALLALHPGGELRSRVVESRDS